MISLFFVVTFFLAWLNKSPGDSGLQKDAQLQQAETATEWWKKGETTESSSTETSEAQTSAASDATAAGTTGNTETAPQSSAEAATDTAAH